MPLTDCPTCKNPLSTAATACPKCGHPVKPAAPPLAAVESKGGDFVGRFTENTLSPAGTATFAVALLLTLLLGRMLGFMGLVFGGLILLVILFNHPPIHKVVACAGCKKRVEESFAQICPHCGRTFDPFQ